MSLPRFTHEIFFFLYRVSSWLVTYQDNIVELGVEFAPMLPKLTMLFSGKYSMTYAKVRRCAACVCRNRLNRGLFVFVAYSFTKTRDFDRMRKDGILSITVKQEELAFPTDDVNRIGNALREEEKIKLCRNNPVMDLFVLVCLFVDLLSYNDLYEWFVFALLACPQLLEVNRCELNISIITHCNLVVASSSLSPMQTTTIGRVAGAADQGGADEGRRARHALSWHDDLSARTARRALQGVEAVQGKKKTDFESLFV
jgi:hypothetical protein